MDRVDEVAILLRTDIFQDVSPAEVSSLLPAVHRHSLAKGAFFYRVGEESTAIWVLVSGQAKMAMPTPGGDETVLEVMVAGQLFGLPGLFSTRGPRVAHSVATEPCVALSIERDALIAFLERHPAAMRRIMTRLADLVREYVEVIMLAAHEDLRGRVARRLLDLAGLHGESGEGGTRISARVPQETLAGMVGATRSKVNGALAKLAASNHISVDEGVITVRDPERLRRDYPDWISPGGRPPVSRGA
jgi:CRP/FNR family cyclic AMP-dependent transcriptional regulator